jgi:hypothetical protein
MPKYGDRMIEMQSAAGSCLGASQAKNKKDESPFLGYLLRE